MFNTTSVRYKDIDELSYKGVKKFAVWLNLDYSIWLIYLA